MKVKILGILAFSAFYTAYTAEAVIPLPPFKADITTIGNEIVAYGNTLSQTASKAVQESSIIQTGITYGQGAKEAYDFATKALNDMGSINLNELGGIMGDIEAKEAESNKVKVEAATEIANKTRETNEKIVELDKNNSELRKKIIEDPDNASKYQKEIRQNEKEKKKLSNNLAKETKKINKDADKKLGNLSDQIGDLQGKASSLISSISTITSSYDSSEDLQETASSLMPGKDTEVNTHVIATYAAIYKKMYINTMGKAMGRVMMIKSKLAEDNEKAEKSKVSTADFESLGGAVGTVVTMKADNIQALLNFTEILLQKVQLDIAKDLATENFGVANPEQAVGDFNLDNYKFTPPSDEEFETAEAEEQEKLGELEKEITSGSGAILTDAEDNMTSSEDKEN